MAIIFDCGKASKMARRYRLRELEGELGDLNEIIPSLVNELGQSEAARKLGVTQATISTWLMDNGYVKHSEWVKEGGDPQPIEE